MRERAPAAVVQRLPGQRPLVVVSDGLIMAQGAQLVHLAHGATVGRPVASVDLAPIERRTLAPRLLQRVLRSGLQCGVEAAAGRLTVASKRGLFGVDLTTGVAQQQPCAARGRPLNLVHIEGVAGFTDQVCFGEYLSNAGRQPVSIWSDGGSGRWRDVFRFGDGQIEHIHSLVPDPARGVVWILAGNFGDAAGIWVARDDFAVVEPVVRGGQRFRAAAAFAVDEGLLYATDSQVEPNSIRMLHESGGRWRSDEVATLPGSSIHGCRLGDRMVFSTTVEPGLGTGFRPFDLIDPRLGPAIERRRSDLFIGNQKRGFERIGSWAKDVWPMGLCGFGTISFPSGVQHGAALAAYGTGLRGFDGVTLFVSA